MDLADFALAQLMPPPAPVRVAGDDELVARLRAVGYSTRTRAPVAATIAIGLPPAARLEPALDEVVAALAPGGIFVLEALAWDLLDDTSAEWLYGQLRLLAAGGHGADPPSTLAAFREAWRGRHAELPEYDQLRSALARRFRESALVWVPALWRELGGPSSAALEQTLVEAGMIRPLGLRYAGVRR
ncbi:MAG: hypothetical protein ACXVY8_00310 [Gaiellaceae bacterium]